LKVGENRGLSSVFFSAECWYPYKAITKPENAKRNKSLISVGMEHYFINKMSFQAGKLGIVKTK